MRRSNRFMSATTCGTSFVQPQRVIGAPWSFSPERWWRRKGQTKAPSSQWLFRFHWALFTALTPFWRCRESDQRCLRLHCQTSHLRGIPDSCMALSLAPAFGAAPSSLNEPSDLSLIHI